MKTPFFSIITVSYNAGKSISKTVSSVLEQDFEDYEIIVKDACSTDGTLSYLPKNDKITVVETPDKGIYYGMNEAVTYANGKFLLFLNCGDFLVNKDVLFSIYNIAKDIDEKTSIIYGDYIRDSIYIKQRSKITPFFLYRIPLCHQSVFFGKNVIENLGGYDTKYRILADYDLTLRAFKSSVDFVHCPIAVADYLGGGISESEEGSKLNTQEFEKLRLKYFTATQRFKYNFIISLTFQKLRQKFVAENTPMWLKKIYRFIANIFNS